MLDLELAYHVAWIVACGVTAALRFSQGHRFVGWVFVVFCAVDLILFGIYLAKQ